MYNGFIILICVFAVYGAYALFRELSAVLLRNNRLVIAIEVTDEETIQDSMVLAEAYIQNNRCFKGKPVLLCEDEDTEKYIKYGLDVYTKSGKESYAAGEQNCRNS